tara:strand:+ start:1842 stop:1985 length:144 start_codon:yes stop_codon:yes gene_type:complete
MHPTRPKSALSKNRIGPFELKAKKITSQQHSEHDSQAFQQQNEAQEE